MAGAERGSIPSGDYVVGEAEGISRIAQRAGLFWQTIWEHPKNADLRSKRPSPEVLCAGDTVFIPPLREQTMSNLATGRRHTFQRRGIPAHIVVTLKDRRGKPFSSCRYELRVGGATLSGTTDGQGRVQQYVDPGAVSATLVRWPARPRYPETVSWALRVSALDPVGTPSGARARLANLGLPTGDESDEAALRDAVEAFQHSNGLPVTGKLDDPTRARLLEAHGS
jgi:N-acetylmuramoyl-L-alanine amidase